MAAILSRPQCGKGNISHVVVWTLELWKSCMNLCSWILLSQISPLSLCRYCHDNLMVLCLISFDKWCAAISTINLDTAQHNLPVNRAIFVGGINCHPQLLAFRIYKVWTLCFFRIGCSHHLRQLLFCMNIWDTSFCYMFFTVIANGTFLWSFRWFLINHQSQTIDLNISNPFRLWEVASLRMETRIEEGTYVRTLTQYIFSRVVSGIRHWSDM